MTRDIQADGGSAIVEYIWLSIILMVPLVYIVLSALSVQRAAFAVTEAARDGARAYATAGSDAEGERRAEQAIAVAMSDQGVSWSPVGRVVDCGGCTYAPGSTFVVRLQTRVRLPFVPSWLCGSTCVAGITVAAHHTEHIDCYGGGPASPGKPTC